VDAVQNGMTNGTVLAKTGDGEGAEPPAMLDVKEVARLLRCSARTVYRLADSGRTPAPVKLGGLVRWLRHAMEQWVADGCPAWESPRR